MAIVTNDQIVSELAALPLIVRGSQDEVFRAVRKLQEAARHPSPVAATVDTETDTFFCENCEKNFTEKPHATADGYWLCDPCHESLKDEAAI